MYVLPGFERVEDKAGQAQIMTHSTRSGHDRKITIALLTTGAIDPNNCSIWSVTVAACRDAGVSLVRYPGRLVHSPVELEAQRNVIYR